LPYLLLNSELRIIPKTPKASDIITAASEIIARI